MIHLSRLHDAGSIVINADLIETIEACPDTTITLMTKRKFVVADPLENVIEKVITYRQRISAAFLSEDPATVAHPFEDVAAAGALDELAAAGAIDELAAAEASAEPIAEPGGPDDIAESGAPDDIAEAA